MGVVFLFPSEDLSSDNQVLLNFKKEKPMNRRKSCKGCYFYGDCPGRKICEYFTPASKKAEESELSRIQRRNRDEFMREWNSYVSYSEDDDESGFDEYIDDLDDIDEE